MTTQRIEPAIKQAQVNGLRLNYVDWGEAGRPPMVLLHGFSAQARYWDGFAIHLRDAYHVYALDQRGHGDSDPAETYGAVAAFDDLSGVVDQLGLAPVIMVGLSMGGRNAMYFASKRPDLVRKLVVLDIGPEISKKAAEAPSGPPEPDVWESIEQAAQHLLRANPYPGIHYYRWVVSHSLRTRPEGGLVWAWHPSIKLRRGPDMDWWAILRAITTPTLVLRGAESRVLDRDVAERMARELPNGRLVEIPRAVHTLHEDNPDAVLAALKDFLAF
jgi:esterase